ncbi:hypothetical protein Ct61P_14296 [Colletotrichum tofieldiae]|nr:hypothetical protein Ct61P_14296 [Colletotrichum tofieldiae]
MPALSRKPCSGQSRYILHHISSGSVLEKDLGKLPVAFGSCNLQRGHAGSSLCPVEWGVDIHTIDARKRELHDLCPQLAVPA